MELREDTEPELSSLSLNRLGEVASRYCHGVLARLDCSRANLPLNPGKT